MGLIDYNSALESFFEKVPRIDLAYIKGLTSLTGIYQHAKFNIPDYHHGYCLDDNTRALLLFLMVSEEGNEPLDNNLVKTYLAYLYFSQKENGWLRNFMSYDLRFLETTGSEDSMGRTIWTIGFLLAHKKFSKYHAIGKEIFDRIVNHVVTFKSIRAIAYSILGILYFLEKYPNQKSQLHQLNYLLGFVAREYGSASSERWPWFEEILTYEKVEDGIFINVDLIWLMSGYDGEFNMIKNYNIKLVEIEQQMYLASMVINE